MNIEQIKYDCRYFRGEIPCKPNKLRKKECFTCDEYNKINYRILIVKLGATGDVIRSTPLIHKFRKVLNIEQKIFSVKTSKKKEGGLCN